MRKAKKNLGRAQIIGICQYELYQLALQEDGARKSFNKFTPPPCASRKESASGSLRTLFGVGSHNIFLEYIWS
jgi:hypothetical protein